MGMRINHLVMIFTTEGQLVWCSAVNSRRLFCGDFGDVFLYLRMFLKVKNQMPKFKCWFLLAGFLLDYLHVNRCYAVEKMVIWLGLIYNVIDLRKYSFIIYCKCYEYCIWNPNLRKLLPIIFCNNEYKYKHGVF